jgi:hypothetical protein
LKRCCFSSTRSWKNWYKWVIWALPVAEKGLFPSAVFSGDEAHVYVDSIAFMGRIPDPEVPRHPGRALTPMARRKEFFALFVPLQ